MKLIIQIPCFNEEDALPLTLSKLPRKLDGVDSIEWLVIDDGSSDRTVEVAKSHGVDHIVSLPSHRGLAHAFMRGLDAGMLHGADIIVNTDADNQYDASCIPDLIAPILQGKADVVIGSRPIGKIEHFSPIKKLLQRFGSSVVRHASGTEVEDAPSGFRAISRDAALRLNVFSSYTYTLETIIQAGQKGMTVVCVPIRVNEDLRPSRLVKSVMRYVWRSMTTILGIFTIYSPFRAFLAVGSCFLLLALLISMRFLAFYFSGDGVGHVQSLILAGILFNLGFFLVLSGVLAYLISVNRCLMEDMQWRMRKLERDESGKVPSSGTRGE